MKIFTLFFAMAFTSISLIAQDTIPNPGFESWSFNPAPAYNTPNGWSCLNPLTDAVNIYTCYQDSATVHSGKYAAELITRAIGTPPNVQLAPGILTTGNISEANGVTGGIPFNSRPLYLNGWYQYAPINHDSASMGITFTQWSASGDSEIVVGSGIFYAGSTVNSWTQFTVPVTYNSGATPDSMQILFFSSAAVTFQAGSTLILDDVSFSNTPPAGITETPVSPINIYPNPASAQINIDNQTMLATSLNLYAVSGQLVQNIKMHAGNNIVDVSALPAGVYLLSGFGANGNAYRSSVVIDK